MDEAILKELQKINKFLEQIDWKLWNFYDSSFNKTSGLTTGQVKQVPESVPTLSTKTLVKSDANNPFAASTDTPAVKPIISVPKYPSIEEL